MLNLFDYAQKELSLDAIITCLVKEEKIQKDFVKDLLKTFFNDKIIDSIVNVKQQENNMDISFDINYQDKDGNAYHDAVIIEDKVDTFLHNYQLINYIDLKAKEQYNHIHFALIKTGSYYFWEENQYKLEQQLINEPLNENPKNFYNGLFIGDNKIINNIKEIKDSKIEVKFYTYLKKDLLNFVNRNNGFKEFLWAKDYINYLNQPITPDWRISCDKISADMFVDNLFNKKVKENYMFNIPNGKGKRNCELLVYGYCGEDALSRTKTADTIKKRYYLLPVINIGKNQIKIKLQVHLFENSAEKFGYCSTNDLVDNQKTMKIGLQKDIINKFEDDFIANGWAVNHIKDDTLEVFSWMGGKWNNTNDQIEIKQKAAFLIDKVKEIQDFIEKKYL